LPPRVKSSSPVWPAKDLQNDISTKFIWKNPVPGYAIPAVAFKSIIAVFLGLVIQLAQLQGGAAAIRLAASCDPDSRPMSCCTGECPCIKESKPVQKPAPLAPANGELKVVLAKAPDTSGVDNLLLPPDDAPPRGPCLGQVLVTGLYAGVPPQVAFCSFVI